jgi:GAF domain-containing protein
MTKKNVSEEERLSALRSMGILDTEPEPRFDMLTKTATQLLKVPISTISLIDQEREWFKSCQGVDTKEGPRAIAFCSEALKAEQIFIVENTLEDERFKNNPYVINKPFIRFYAGVVLRDKTTGASIGVLCVKDTKPRKMTPSEISLLLDLAGQAEEELNKKT